MPTQIFPESIPEIPLKRGDAVFPLGAPMEECVVKSSIDPSQSNICSAVSVARTKSGLMEPIHAACMEGKHLIIRYKYKQLLTYDSLLNT